MLFFWCTVVHGHPRTAGPLSLTVAHITNLPVPHNMWGLVLIIPHLHRFIPVERGQVIKKIVSDRSNKVEDIVLWNHLLDFLKSQFLEALHHGIVDATVIIRNCLLAISLRGDCCRCPVEVVCNVQDITESRSLGLIDRL